MKAYLEKLKAQIEAEPLTFYGGGDAPALEALYFHYTECYCMHSDLTKQISAELNDLTNGLAFVDADKICTLSSELAAEHERIAFIAGLQLGAQLVMELPQEQGKRHCLRDSI